MVAPSEPTGHNEELLAAAVDVALRRGRFSDPSTDQATAGPDS